MDSGRIEFLCSRGTSATPSSSGSASLHGGLPAHGRPETAAGLSVPGPLRVVAEIAEAIAVDLRGVVGF